MLSRLQVARTPPNSTVGYKHHSNHMVQRIEVRTTWDYVFFCCEGRSLFITQPRIYFSNLLLKSSHKYIPKLPKLKVPLYLSSIIFTAVFATLCLCVDNWQWQVGVTAMFLEWTTPWKKCHASNERQLHEEQLDEEMVLSRFSESLLTFG